MSDEAKVIIVLFVCVSVVMVVSFLTIKQEEPTNEHTTIQTYERKMNPDKVCFDKDGNTGIGSDKITLGTPGDIPIGNVPIPLATMDIQIKTPTPEPHNELTKEEIEWVKAASQVYPTTGVSFKFHISDKDSIDPGFFKEIDIKTGKEIKP